MWAGEMCTAIRIMLTQLSLDNLNDLDISAFRPRDWPGLGLGADVAGKDPLGRFAPRLVAPAIAMQIEVGCKEINAWEG